MSATFNLTCGVDELDMLLWQRSSNISDFFSRVPGSIARRLKVWDWVSRAASAIHGLVRRTGVFPNLPYFCICDSSGWASVKIRPRKACNYPNLRSFGWVLHDKVGVLYSRKLGSRSKARASDPRSYPGL